MNRVEYTPFQAVSIEFGITPDTEAVLTQHHQKIFQRAKNALALLRQNGNNLRAAQAVVPWHATSTPKALAVTLIALMIIFGGIFGSRAFFLNKNVLAGSLIAGGAGLTYLVLSYFIARRDRYAPLWFLGALIKPLYCLSRNGVARQNLPGLGMAYKDQLQTTAEELKMFFSNHSSEIAKNLLGLAQHHAALQQAQQRGGRGFDPEEARKIAFAVEQIPQLIDFYTNLRVN